MRSSSFETRRSYATPFRSGLLAVAVLAGAVGCGDLDIASGATDVLQVQAATFRTDAWPGRVTLPDAERPSGPRVTAIEAAGGIGYPGQIGRFLSGRVSNDAAALGVRAAEGRAGWWVLPVGGPEPTVPTENTFEVFYTLRDLTPGLQQLQFVAIDEQGRGGPQRELGVCIASELPDNLNVCDPTREPPAVVVSLRWNGDVDLNLEAQSADGRAITARTTVSGAPGVPAATRLADPTQGRIDRNSNGGCRIDGRRRESISFPQAPSGDVWLFSVRLVDACGLAGTAWTLETWYRESVGDGAFRLTLLDEVSGYLRADQADGGAGPAQYVTNLQFP